jgi:hypothetical protein
MNPAWKHPQFILNSAGAATANVREKNGHRLRQVGRPILAAAAFPGGRVRVNPQNPAKSRMQAGLPAPQCAARKLSAISFQHSAFSF